ncbi:hypothetical protein KP509_06G014900 [Ceratopteris richardii]|uniref:Uncharacterized protein n=1 Tax=Ceratopteris richardii TaxID=49495 RepID=A0A8T2UDP0_CERRI|nr:hypothetical protein KP509_06G014900 [Ceratopteris richardii]
MKTHPTTRMGVSLCSAIFILLLEDLSWRHRECASIIAGAEDWERMRQAGDEKQESLVKTSGKM